MNTERLARAARTLPATVALSVAAAACNAQPGTAIAFNADYGAGQAKTLALDGGEAVYLEKGEGMPLVFFYPGYDYRYWQWQVEAASAHYHTVAVSFAPRATGLPFDLLSTDELAAALEGLGLGPVYLVSHSIGAWQAMALASERPELFRSLVLEEPAVGLNDAPAPECSLPDPSEAELADCLFSSLVSGPGWFESLPAEFRRYSTEFAVGTPQTDETGETVDPVDTEFPSICDAIAELEMPILFIRGEQTPPHIQVKLDDHEACLPAHETVTIAGASHSVHIDQADEYNRAVLEFVERNESSSAATPQQTRVASVDGGRIEYVVSGPVEGDPVLLIHGAMLGTAFALVQEQLSLEGFRTIRVHRRGFVGSSDDLPQPARAVHAADALAVLDDLGVETAHVVGHSSGARYALQALASAPERVQSLVMIDPASIPGIATTPPETVRIDLIEAAFGAFEEGNFEGALEAFAHGVFGDDWREYFDAIPGGYEQALADAERFTGDQGSTPFDAARISATERPIRVLWAEANASSATVDELAESLPEAEVGLIADTDHALITQKPEEVAQDISAFIRRHFN